MKTKQKKHDEPQNNIREEPLCLSCLHPVDPLYHYCPNCGRAVGQLTPVMPYESLRWQADIWGRMWKQLWLKDISIPGKFLRLLMIIWFAPIILIGIIPKLWQKKEARSDK